MITNNLGEKVSAKIKVKLLLKEYLDNFTFEEMKEWSKGDLTHINDQIEKIKNRLYKNLIVKTGE